MKNLKLNSLASKSLSETQMNEIKGGDCSCGCGCLYANSGGSSTNSNANANRSGGYFSEYNKLAYCDGRWIKAGGAPRDSDF